MSYSNFTLTEIVTVSGLVLDDQTDLFSTIADAPLSSYLQTTLSRNIPLALAVHTEKARSEFIVAPILIELRELMNRQISLFSGVDFSVDAERGLNGVCDFIISRSPKQLFVSVPVIMLVEAKNDNVKGGLAQCIAEMVAAHLFNVREENQVTVYGCVTTGSTWKFLKLEETTIFVDPSEYYIDQAGKILGILIHIVTGG